MENTQSKISFVDKAGIALTEEKLGTATREKVADNILSFMLADPERSEQFFGAALQSLPQDHFVLEDGKAAFSKADPVFRDFCILFATQTVMNQALDEDLSEAYQLLTAFTGAVKYKMQDEVQLTEQEIKDLERYYAPVPELLLAEQICSIQLELAQTMTGNSEKMPTSFQTNRIQEKIDEILPYLTEEQCAAAYYNVSLMHRALLTEKDYYDPSENNAEKDCLKKVLEYTSDYNRINYCLNRLGSHYDNQGLLRAAYRRALDNTDNQHNAFRINEALAECYVADYHPQVGFKTDSERHIDKEEQKLERAERHYQEAFDLAPDAEKFNLLKKIGKLQLRRSKLDEWTKTQTKMAFEFMTDEARCQALLEVATRNKALQRPYLERAIIEAKKSRAMKKNNKSLMIHKAARLLRPIYIKEQDSAALATLDKVMAKYAPIKAEDKNPLLAYKSKQTGLDSLLD